jgi:hypothetical protein
MQYIISQLSFYCQIENQGDEFAYFSAENKKQNKLDEKHTYLLNSD